MPRHLMTVLLPLCCAVFLTACGETRLVPQIQTIRLSVPPSLLACRAAPAPPPVETQRDVARYVIDLYDAGADCRDKLREVRGLVDADAK